MVSVAVAGVVPLGVTEAGLMLQVASLGAPEQASDTAWLKPLGGLIVIVSVTEPLWLTVPLDWARLMLKSAAAAVMVTLTGAEVEGASVVFPAYAAVMECVPVARLLVE
jgi:hypothetical protein